MNFHKWYTLDRAKKLIEQETDETLRYACLELRYCIEAIAYETLLIQEKRIPKDILEIWQPRKVLEMLVEYEPDIEKDYIFEFWTEDNQGKPEKRAFAGKHHSITLGYIKKHYNKLGYYLHVPTPAHQKKKGQTKKETLKAYLQEVITELEKFVSNTFSVAAQPTITFTCQRCNETVIRNLNSLKKEKFITCFNPECKAQYEWKGENAQSKLPEFQLRQVSFICPKCEARNYLDYHLLKEGMLVKCAQCHTEWLLEQVWRVVEYNQTKEDS